MKCSILILSVFSLLVFFVKPVKGQLAGQEPLDPSLIPQFVDPLPHFAGMRVNASEGKLIIRYEPTQQIAVSTGTELENGTVGETPGAGLGNYWGYSISTNGKNFTPAHWPAFSVEAQRGKSVKVIYENKLGGQTYANVNLVADQTLHWADPLMEMDHMNREPYAGPVPVSPHLHGGEVPSESDGGPDAWFTPDYGITGPAWEMGVDQNYLYPNTQEEATLWFHDHALGVTRLNVYAGLAGFYLLRGTEERALKLPGWPGDDLVLECAPEGTSGTFNPKPYLPEIEIAIQDRMFDTHGELYFPNVEPMGEHHPFWNPEFIGNIITVNGKTWPYLSVAPRKYRFRVLNGSNARFYLMDLIGSNGETRKPLIHQIGTDGGFLDAPVQMDELLLAPGERADLIIDFSTVEFGSHWTWTNSAPIPFPDGEEEADPETTGQIMRFVVNGQMISAANPVKTGIDKSQVPKTIRRKPMVKLTDFKGSMLTEPAVKRQLTLNEVMHMDGPMVALVNNSKWDMNGMMTPGLGVTEMPVEGTTELWQIINTTGDAHPMHLHLVQFQLVSRQAFDVEEYEEAYHKAFEGGEYQPADGPPLDYNTPNADGAIGGNPAVSPFLEGSVKPAELNERGWKDTYIAYPGEVTTFAIRFAPTDLPLNAPKNSLIYAFDPSKGPGYVWHCHIIDHEDNEMMRPYSVKASPVRSGSPLAQKPINDKEKDKKLNPGNKPGLLLGQNYPNPVWEQTLISFNLSESMPVRLTLLDKQGQTVKVLLDQVAPAGNNTVQLHAEGLAKGIYFYQLNAGTHTETKKMVIK